MTINTTVHPAIPSDLFSEAERFDACQIRQASEDDQIWQAMADALDNPAPLSVIHRSIFLGE